MEYLIQTFFKNLLINFIISIKIILTGGDQMYFLKRNTIKFLLAGRTVSTLGDSLYQIAVVWYIFELTQSTIFTGIAIASISIPQALNFLFGPVIEKMNKRNILVYAQFIQFLLMSIVPIYIIFNYENVYIVLIIMFLVSFMENFQGTAEMSIVPQLVEKNEIGNFNSLNNSLQQIISILITGMFSVIIIYVGIRDVYLFNSLTFLIAFFLFSQIKSNQFSQKEVRYVEKELKEVKRSKYKKELFEGLLYFNSSKLLIITIPFVLANGMLSAVNAVLPKYADFLGDTKYYGFLVFSISVGLLLGSILSTLVMRYSVGKVFIILPLFTGLLWVISLNQTNLVLSLIVFGLSLVPFGMMNIIFLTLNQQSVDQNLLSRILSISDSFLFISIPVGALIGGYIGSRFSPLVVMYGSATSFLLISAFYLFHPFLRKLPPLENLKLLPLEDLKVGEN